PESPQGCCRGFSPARCESAAAPVHNDLADEVINRRQSAVVRLQDKPQVSPDSVAAAPRAHHHSVGWHWRRYSEIATLRCAPAGGETSRKLQRDDRFASASSTHWPVLRCCPVPRRPT